MEYSEDQLLDYVNECLSISAFFEGGDFNPRYDNVTGDFDDMGMSIGALQWCAGQGSMQHLLSKCIEQMGDQKANGYFNLYGNNVITNLSKMNKIQAKNYVLATFIDFNKNVKKDAKESWENFLNDEDVVLVQKQMAKDEVLYKALRLVGEYVPGYEDNLRCISFFFDVVVQSGGMSNNRGHVEPIDLQDASSFDTAISEARNQGKNWTADKWQEAVDTEDISKWLLHYAFERAQLSLPRWQWDTLSRRGTIATRWGYVHGTKLDLTGKLP